MRPLLLAAIVHTCWNGANAPRNDSFHLAITRQSRHACCDNVCAPVTCCLPLFHAWLRYCSDWQSETHHLQHMIRGNLHRQSVLIHRLTSPSLRQVFVHRCSVKLTQQWCLYTGRSLAIGMHACIAPVWLQPSRCIHLDGSAPYSLTLYIVRFTNMLSTEGMQAVGFTPDTKAKVGHTC